MATLTEAQKKAKLILDPPSELRFRGPFVTPVITTLKLTNPTDETILFKIKTTAPKRYCVRPNLGYVNANETVNVEICLQPFNYDPNERNKHKFMVQSLHLLDDEYKYEPSKIWKDFMPERIVDAKLKCVFEMPDEDAIKPPNDKLVKDVPTPKVRSEEKISNVDTSDQPETQTDDLRQLREEISALQKENLNLKEQVVRLRFSPSKPAMVEQYTPVMTEKQIPMFYIAIAVAVLIFGIILGKYLL